MCIWKDILLKKVVGSKLKNAKTISKEDYNKKFQVFEVLITETLAIVDPNTEWHSLPVQGDHGIDFLGEMKPVSVPYIISKPNEIVLGQIKRRSGTYRKDDFRYDIIKIIDYYKDNFAQKSALCEIIHVLSTDKKIDTTLWLENITFPYTSYKVLPVNAIDFLRFWKVNPSFLTYILNEAFTDEELHPLFDYIDKLQENWDELIITDVQADNYARIDDEINIRVSITSNVNLSIPLYLEWNPPTDNSDIVMIYPQNMVKNNINNYLANVHKKFSIQIKLKSIKSGEKDLGTLNIYSASHELISTFKLGHILIQNGIVNKFYDSPCVKQLNVLKGYIKNKAPIYKMVVLTGPGGIGKSSISQELTLYAQNQGYYTITVQNSNDLINSRNIILDIFIKLLSYSQNIFVSYENVHEMLRISLGANFLMVWNESLMKYITNEELSSTDLEYIAQCLLTLLIVQSNLQSIFIWLSDLHWGSKETLILFEKLLNLVRLNYQYFNNQVFFLFEGRDGETLNYEDKVIYPYKWLEFCNSDILEKCQLFAWKEEYSLEYMKMIINPFSKKENKNMQELLNILCKYSSGNPMHIKELIHYLVESGNIFINNDGTMILANRQVNFTDNKLDTHDIILKRIYFYKDKYPEIIDYYIILANIISNLPEIYSYVNRILSKKYPTYSIIEKDIGMVSTNAEKIFIHEYYKELLKEQIIADDAQLENILKYYQQNFDDTIDGQIDLVILSQLSESQNYEKIYSDLQKILIQNINDYQALQCYQLLLQIPPKFNKDYALPEIYFQMSEIVIRIGSWKDSQKYLEKILKCSANNSLYYIIACKNLGNMYGVGLELKKSLDICEMGIKLVKDEIDKIEDVELKTEYKRQYEMLLNRIAVTYWFCGQPSMSEPYQNQALTLAQERGDDYSISHTLYEMGMRQLHQDIFQGNKNIQKALDMLPKKEKYTEKQERFLVQAELLISNLLIYERDGDEALLNNILDQSENLCEELYVDNANYESALCHIVNGICNIYKNTYEKALDMFYIGLDNANIGEFKTLQWKIYLNIAETLLLISDQKKSSDLYDQAKKFAEIGYKILTKARERNQDMESYLILTALPYQQFEDIINENLDNIYTIESNLIKIKYKKYFFYIMD